MASASEPTFATLPTPFKAVAVDLRTAEAVVLDRGSLARAMRATMSLPGVFPPVEAAVAGAPRGGAQGVMPQPAFVTLEGVGAVDERRMNGSRTAMPSTTGTRRRCGPI